EPQHLYSSGRGTRKIDFIHLPSKCTIKIFTLSGKLVDTFEHDATGENGAESWDMLSRDGLEIAYGIYIFHVDAPGIGTHVGKFAVIK
ncbi:MAG: T9SS C-terminal target domain-containing protein, partial [Candidatus Marinimicrobia bacterium CG_4_9_14_3_um_filter_48_9]